MYFSSLVFLFRFLPLILLIYFMVPRKLKNAVLFFASLFFYAWGEPKYVVLMIFSTIVDYTHGLLVEKYINEGRRGAAKKVVFSSAVINLTLLGFFKYFDFLMGTINSVFNAELPVLNLALPIGISFYTFQTMSYTIDVYRGDAKSQKNIISFGAYVALFPQLIAGPIVRFKTIAEALDSRKENISKFAYGIRRFICGLTKKVFLANNIGLLWDNIKAMPDNEVTTLMAWIGIVAYAFQIYFDFSGYSDMAIGLGAMFGFEFLENFNYPYISKSITEFWRRWHMSLGTWFKEYVYIPLGGNRAGTAKQIRNIAIVWLLTGFWHGAAWNFVLWGVYFGVILVIEKTFILKRIEKLPAVCGHIYALILILIGWVIFESGNNLDGIMHLKAMFGITEAGLVNAESLYTLTSYAGMFIILAIASVNPFRKIKQNKVMKTIVNVCLPVMFFICVAYLVDASYNPFLYFRF